MSVKVIITIDTEEDQWDQYCTFDTPINNIDMTRTGKLIEIPPTITPSLQTRVLRSKY